MLLITATLAHQWSVIVQFAHLVILLDPYILEHLLSLFALVCIDSNFREMAGAHAWLRLVIEQFGQ